MQVVGKFVKLATTSRKNETVLEFLNNLWGLGTGEGIGFSTRTGPPEPVFLNVYGAQESIPRNEFRQPM